MGPCVRRDDGGICLNQQITQIAPMEVLALDQLDLPVALPPLQLLLPTDGFVRTIIGLDINKPVNSMGIDKRGTLATAMLRQPLLQLIRHPDIQSAMASTGENVDVVHARSPEWMLSL